MSWLEPRRRGEWELRLQRAGLALLLAWQFPALPRYDAQPYPVGVARWIDFSFLGQLSAAWLYGVFAVALMLYVLGRLMPLAVCILLVLWVGVCALLSSQGAVGHFTQLLSLVLCAQFVAYLRAAWSAWRTGVARDGHDLAVDYSMQVVAAGYVLAGLSKLINSHGRWIAQVPLMASGLSKLHGQHYADSLDPRFIARGDALATFVLTHPTVMRVLLGSGLLLELSAPLALCGRTAAAIVGLALIGMHRGIDQIMLLRFPAHEALLLIYFVNLPYLIVWSVGRLTGARRDATGAA